MYYLDSFLNRITMYRLVLYYLAGLLGVAAIFGAVGIMPYNPAALLVSALILVASCWGINRAIAGLFRIPTNTESSLITALILALIITPISVWPLDQGGFWFLIAAAAFAMASKYLIAFRRKHLFNPAAFGVAATAFVIGQYASWWIGGNLPMLPFVLGGGFLVLRKIKRFDLAAAFFAAGIASILATNIGFDPVATVEKAAIHTSLLFFAFVMITEPLTTPPTRGLRIAYGALVGALFSPAIHLGPFYATPELALLVGNIFSFAVSPKEKHILKLAAKEPAADGTYDFVFHPPRAIRFQPGQYFEWTLAHPDADARGNRRYFTIASSPTEPEFRIGVRFYDPPSSFKKAMLAMKPGDAVLAGSLAGDFLLPPDPREKLAFIAGGIGITPFRSMAKYLTDRQERRDVVLLYSNRRSNEIAYADIFKAAESIGFKTVYAITGNAGNAPNGKNKQHHQHERINSTFIAREIPDYRERTFYISGPRSMIDGATAALHSLGVRRSRIKTDFFPGFA